MLTYKISFKNAYIIKIIILIIFQKKSKTQGSCFKTSTKKQLTQQ